MDNTLFVPIAVLISIDRNWELKIILVSFNVIVSEDYKVIPTEINWKKKIIKGHRIASL